jgi:hypothetical protein
MAQIIRNPKPGTRLPSPIERRGYWVVPEGCVYVVVAEPTGYPITHKVRRPSPSMRASDRRRS